MRWLVYLLLATWISPVRAERNLGEIRIQVHDATGLPVRAEVQVVNAAAGYDKSVVLGPAGAMSIRGIAFGVYEVSAAYPQFATETRAVDVHSELPVGLEVVLAVRGGVQQVAVDDASSLMDPRATTNAYVVGGQELATRRSTVPSRSLIELIEAEPGWVLEAGGVLHPRGAEYGVQYVVDGVPMTDNRSPGFAPPLSSEEFSSIRVLTGGYPAEYGRRLGGVIEANSLTQNLPGWHGRATAQVGIFDTQTGFASVQKVTSRSTATATLEGAGTARYLDPPTIANYANRGTMWGGSAGYEREITDRDRIRVQLQRRDTRFNVPNEIEQQEAGQRQDRAVSETMGQASWEHVLSSAALLQVRGMARDLSADLWSNAFATPVDASQTRGFRDVYLQSSVAGAHGKHDWKAGAEFIGTAVEERFRYRITDSEFFDQDVPGAFSFTGKHRARESAAFVQDGWRSGPLTINAGVRWDDYRFLVHDSAFSPRLGAAWHWPRAGMVFRASYDRAFEVPATENLLLASSAAAQHLTPGTTGLPVPPSRGDFFQAGFTAVARGRVRLDGTYFVRSIRNFADDSVMLNTGVTFPIAFAHGRIHGFEAKLEVLRAGRLSGFASYSNLAGTAELPVTGGLFLAESADLLEAHGRIPITQDQRNTVQTRWRYELPRGVWLASGWRFGSGLPVENDTPVDPARFDPRIVERVDLERGRVRPWWSLDFSAGAAWRVTERARFRMQADLVNATDQLIVINFAGLFSGTALGAPRSAYVRAGVEF